MRVADADLHSARAGRGWEWVKPAAFCMYSTVQIGVTYPLLRRPVAPYTRTATGSSDVPALLPSLEQKAVFRPPSCMHIPVSLRVPLLRPGLKRRSWQGFFFSSQAGTIVLRWSKRGDSLGVGAVKNPNAWRRLGSRSWTEPCHAGTEGFRVSV